MHIAEQKILNKFKREPTREISTTELTMESEFEEYQKVLSGLTSDDKKISIGSKRLKGKLHRKTLYHLNSLVNEGILKVSSIVGRGEKKFSLTMNQGELVITKNHRQITITKQNSFTSSLIDKYEKDKVIQNYDSINCMSRVFSVLIKPDEKDGLNSFYSKVHEIFYEVNDVIGIIDIEKTIEKSSKESIIEVIKQMNNDTKDLDTRLCIVIDLEKINDMNKLLEFSEEFCKIKPRTITIVYRGNNRALRGKTDFLKQTCKHHWLAQIKFNFQNTITKEAPIIIGKAGSYSYSDEEWSQIKNNELKILCLSNISISLDVSKFYNQFEGTKEFRELVKKIAITMLKASNLQMKNVNEHFKKINEYGRNNTNSPFLKQKSHIRIWNYDLKNKKQTNFLELLQSTVDEIKDFCKKEREIYSACGLPTSFDISFSSAFSKFSANFSKREYAKTTIKKFSDFENDEIKNFFLTKEKIAKIFNGEDRARIFRKGDFEQEQITKELMHITSTYDLNLLTYDFREVTNELKLTNFI